MIHARIAGATVLERWELKLLNSSTARHAIQRELRQSDRADVRVGEGRPIHEAMTYLASNGDRMDYAAARRRSPSASVTSRPLARASSNCG